MNFIEYYKSESDNQNRGNYVIEAPEGFGKTTILKKLYNDCREELILGRGNILPIYIRMADLNVKSVDFIRNGILFGFVQESFFNLNSWGSSIEKIIGMIKDSEKYRFLFLLDGLNEVVDRKLYEDGETIFEKLQNEFKYNLDKDRWFIDNKNVDIIITTRNRKVLSEEFYEQQKNNEHRLFKIIHLTKLPTKIDKSIELSELLSTPMLAAMYTEMMKADDDGTISDIKTKYELLGAYYKLDTVLNRNTRLADFKDRRVEIVLNQILPIIALKVETSMLHAVDEQDSGKAFAEIQKYGLDFMVDGIINEQKIEIGTKTAVDTIKSLNVIDAQLRFSHDMIREYWTVKGFYWCTQYDECIEYEKELKNLFEYILKYTERKRDYEPIRQTLHIGLMETMISSQNGDFICEIIEKKLKSVYGEYYKSILFKFVYNYCSYLDDEQQRKNAAIYAWKVYEYLKSNQKLENDYIEKNMFYELAGIYNSLAYCTNNNIIDGKTGEDVLKLLEKSQHYLDQIAFDNSLSKKRKEDIFVLQGKIKNNIGACYYGAYYKDYEKALKYHKDAWKYRSEHNIDLCASYRVIASDYFWLKRYVDSYEEYKDFLRYITGGTGERLSEENVRKKVADKATKDEYYNNVTVIIINSIGTECSYILAMGSSMTNENDSIIEEMKEEITYQFEFCVNHMDRGSRVKAIDLIKKIDRKIDEIQSIMKFFNEKQKNKIEVSMKKFDIAKREL